MLSWICCWNNANSNENRDNADGEELEPFQKKHDEEENEILSSNVKKPVFKQPGPAVAAVVRSNENDENQIFLCCADQRIREDQIDFCPKFWFREFSNNKSSSNNNSRKNHNNNSKCSCRKRVQTVIWRICFLLTCLPMCYPCYLSRSIRRRKRQKIISSDMVSQERLGIQDDLNRTIRRQVTHRSQSSPEKKSSNSYVININVIRLHSPASHVLNQYFKESSYEEAKNTHIVHPPQNGGQQNSNSADSNPSSFLQVHHEPRSTRSISRVLTSVPETVPEDEAVTSGDGVDGALFRVREQEGVDGESEVKLRRKSNVIHHRKSSVLMRLPRLRRPSKSFKRQSSLEEEEITIRRRGPRSQFQDPKRKKSSRKLSIVSGGSIYYGYDSSDEEDQAFLKNEEAFSPTTSHEMVTLGKRTELIRDLDCQVIFTFFDEANVADWKGRDLRQANSIPNIDLLLLTIRKDNYDELKNVMRLDTGILGYISKFWRGFFPILIVELYNDNEIEETKPLSEEYGKLLEQLGHLFGDVHQIPIKESELKDDWILESMARLFLHSRILQCSRFFGADVIKTMHFRGCPCPGSCGLTKEQMRKSQKILRKKAKKRRSKIPKNNIASAN